MNSSDVGKLTVFFIAALTLFTAYHDAATQEVSQNPDRDTRGREEREEAEENPDKITIIADYRPMDPENVSAQVTVITEDEIKASSPRNVAEILAPVVGVQVNRYGGITQPSMVTIRGSSPEQVLVLINGKRMNSAQGGGVDFSTISPDDIERIEIIRGGGSAIFGESAFGGVVNIITKRGYGKELDGKVEYEFGSFNTHNVNGQIMGGIGREKEVDFFFSVDGTYSEGSYTYSDSHASEGERARVNAGGLMGNSSFKLGWDIDKEKEVRLSLSGQIHEDKKGVPGLIEFPSESAELRDRRYVGLLSFNFLKNPIAATTLDVYGNWQWRHYTDPEFYLGAVDDVHDNKAVGTDLNLSRMDDFDFLFLKSTLGYSFRYDTLVSTGLIKSGGDEAEGIVTRGNHSGFFRSELNLFSFEESGRGRVTLSPAVRFDLHRVVFPDDEIDKTEYDFSWNVGCMVPFGPEARVIAKGNIGTSYRLPSFDDLFWPATAFAVGNPNLEPEDAFVYDIGLLIRPYDFVSMEIVHFSHDVTNLIQWNPGPNGQWRPTNIGEALLNGLEARITFLFQLDFFSSYLELEANYTYLFARDMVEGSATYGMQLPRRPFEQAGFKTTLTHIRGHSLWLGGRFVGYRYMTAQNTKYLPSYFVLDCTLRIQLGDHFYIIAAGKNLLGTAYIDVREYPVPGRELSISGGFQF